MVGSKNVEDGIEVNPAPVAQPSTTKKKKRGWRRTRKATGTIEYVMLMTTSENTGIEFYDVERFAVNSRLNATDNENKLPTPLTIAGANFVESTLPYAEVITSAESLSGPNGNAPFVIDQSYRTTGSTASEQRGVNRNNPQPPAQRVTARAGLFRPEPLLDDLDQAAFKKMTDTPSGSALEGSGGNYLSNEVFYRTAVVRI